MASGAAEQMGASTMKWTFFKVDGGQDQGFHDAGVETFKGNFDRYLARELIQNSLDARNDENKPVRVKFELMELERTDVPDVDALAASCSRCAEYWNHQPKAKKFFTEATEILRKDKVLALKFGDYNTKGVLGSDNERSKNWYNLVRCAGASSKESGEGGSFGIGKNAPFAASKVRTVLYSTYNVEGEHIFQGVAKLVSHQHPDGGTAQPTGYLGADKGQSVRDKSQLSTKFLRAEHGTDIIVLGFQENKAWQTDLIYSVLANFWPAISFGDLEVTIGDTRIHRDNLKSLLEQYSASPSEDFMAYRYYQAYESATKDFHQELPQLKRVSLYLLAGDASLPKRILMIRKTGMVIFEKPFRGMIPFCGVFMCRNEEGNRLLREMEPPRHDIWDPDHPEKGVNRKIETEYVNFIRAAIKELTPADNSTVISVPELNRYLPDDADSPEESFDSSDESSGKTETFTRRALPEQIQGEAMSAAHQPPPEHEAADAEENPESQLEEDASGEEFTTSGTTHTDGFGEGTGEGGGGGGGDPPKGGGEATQVPGSHGGSQPKQPIPVRFRTFSRDAAAGVYTITVSPVNAGTYSARLGLKMIGDDQTAPAELAEARTAAGVAIPVSPSGAIGPVSLSSSEPLRLEVVLRRPLRVAMELVAHEA